MSKGVLAMLSDVSGYSVDKVKFWMELTPVEATTRRMEWQDVFGQLVGPQGGRVYNIESVKKGERDGSFYYAFDVWGEAASLVDNLDFSTWHPHLDRIDFKIIMPMTEQGRDNYREYLKEKLNGHRSLRLMDTPQRQKRGSRDAGGHTLALGSHKSDYRVHWTLRGSETGYQEFQLEGTRIELSKSFQRYLAGKHPDYMHDGGWTPFCQHILVSAQIELRELDGLHDYERGAILAGQEDVHGIMEKKLQYIEGYVNRLPKDALFGLYRALELKLFGEPEPPAPAVDVEFRDMPALDEEE